MKTIIKEYLEKFDRQRRKRGKRFSTFALVSLLVASGVLWQLKLTGISMAGDAYHCGMEEHVHTEECYADVLVCGMEEGQILDVPLGSAPEGAPEPVPETSPEPTPEPAPEPEPEPMPAAEPTPTEKPAATEQPAATEEPAAVHHHGPECYERRLICGKTEHTHSAACLNDETADVETAEIWKETLPELTGVWPADLAAVAESQLDYAESTRNFVLAEDGQTRKGYTRYGAWYGNPYGDWNAMFAAFCLRYAGIPDTVPVNGGCDSLYQNWLTAELIGTDTPETANLLFFDRDEDGQADAIGVVVLAQENTYTFIEGDAENTVQRKTCAFDDASILALGVLPVQEPETTPAPSASPEPSAEPEPSASPEPSAQPSAEPEASPLPELSEEEQAARNELMAQIQQETYTHYDNWLFGLENKLNALLGLPLMERPAQEPAQPEEEPAQPDAPLEPAEPQQPVGAGEPAPTETPVPTQAPAGEPVSAEAPAATQEPDADQAPLPEDSKELVVYGSLPADEAALPTVEPGSYGAVGPFSFQLEAVRVVPADYLPPEEMVPAMQQELADLQTRFAEEQHNLTPEALEELSARIDVLAETLDAIAADPSLIASAGAPVTFAAPAPRAAGTELKQYLKNHNGSVKVDLTTLSDDPIKKDANGNYVVKAGDPYKLWVYINAKNGIAPGDYFYQLPSGLTYSPGKGDFVMDDGTVIGTWTLDKKGLMKLNFNKNSSKYSKVGINASSKVVFEGSDKPIEFDGNIFVSVELPKPPANVIVKKIGNIAAKDPQTDIPTRLRWTISANVNENTTLGGQTITDTILPETGANHEFTREDMVNTGVELTITDEKGKNHVVTLKGNTDGTRPKNGFTWSAGGWKYTFPKDGKITLDTGEKFTMTNTMRYSFTMYSTPKKDKITEGTNAQFKNKAEMAGELDTAIIKRFIGERIGDIVKKGQYHADAQEYRWTTTATIPAYVPGTKAEVGWMIEDEPVIKFPNSTGKRDVKRPDLLVPENMKVQITLKDGTSYSVPYYKPGDAAPSGEFVWTFRKAPGAPKETSREIVILGKCQCKDHSKDCQLWKKGKCGSSPVMADNRIPKGYCTCWMVKQQATVVINHTVPAEGLIQEYGQFGAAFRNNVSLEHMVAKNEGTWIVVAPHSAHDSDFVPGMFNKELLAHGKPGPDNNYVASFKITINEAKRDNLVDPGQQLTATDLMSTNLHYIPYSVDVKAEAIDGTLRNLVLNKDYTGTYTPGFDDGSGTKHNKLVLKILNPGPEKYIVTYRCRLVPDQAANTPFSNQAQIILGSDVYKDEIKDSVPDITVTGKKYGFHINKVARDTDEPLPGAVFALYGLRPDGTKYEITRGTTDKDGVYEFITDNTSNIILEEHTPYFLEELEAPSGYKVRPAPFWFIFCDDYPKSGPPAKLSDYDCPEGKALIPIFEAYDGYKTCYYKDIYVLREGGDHPPTSKLYDDVADYSLPETGGPGTHGLMLAGIAMLLAAGGYAAYLLHKHYRGKRWS